MFTMIEPSGLGSGCRKLHIVLPFQKSSVFRTQAPEAVAEVQAAATDAGEQAAAPVMPEANGRALPEIEHAIGPLRQSVLDHLIDSVDAGPQSVAQILAAMPAGTSRNSASPPSKGNSIAAA
jgi:hypothetical protein